jgi:hypothetical protein
MPRYPHYKQAEWELSLIVTQFDHKIPAIIVTRITQPVFIAARREAHRPGPQGSGGAIQEKIHIANQNYEHLLVHVPVGRMRRATRRQLRLMHLDGKSVMEITVQHGSRLIGSARAAGFYRQRLERVRFRWYVAGLRLGARGCKRR